MNKFGVLAAVGLAGAGLWYLSKRTSAGNGGGGGGSTLTVEPGTRYHLRYVGSAQTFEAALGPCYAVIDTIDVYDPYYGEWIPPQYPWSDIIETNADCYVEVLGTCVLTNFVPI